MLYRRPTNTFVAGFIGSPAMNFFNGKLADGRLQVGSYTIHLPDSTLAALQGFDGDVIVGVRPEDFVLGGHAGLAIAAQVEISERLGPEVLVHLRAADLPVAAIGAQARQGEDQQDSKLNDTIVARFDPDFSCSTGDTISLGVNRERIQLFDSRSGASLLDS